MTNALLDSVASGETTAGSAKAGVGRTRPTYSVVVPVYNVEKYLDEFFTSLTVQTIGFRQHIEVVAVDDGSTDRSAKIINRWRRKYPGNISYISKPNGGLSSARNRGLEAASGEWVTFIDPDDLVDKDYFQSVDLAIQKHDSSTAIVSCNYLIYDERLSRLGDTHPLRFRFAAGERGVPIDAPGRDIQVTVNSAFLRRELIVKAGLRFDERIRPGFEDAEFVGRYLMRAPGKQMVFVPAARYVHRRRADRSSLQDGARGRPEQYADELEFGYLGLLREAQRHYGHVPVHIQNTVLFGLSFTFRHALDHPEALSFLSADQIRRYLELLAATMAFIDARTLLDDALHSLSFSQRLGLLFRFKNEPAPYRQVEIAEFDPIKNLAKIVFWSPNATPAQIFQQDGVGISPVYRKSRRHDFLGSPFIWEHIRWLPIVGGTLSISVDNVETRIDVDHHRHIGSIATAMLRRAFVKPRVVEVLLPPDQQMVRAAARSPAATAKYANAWLFMDRDTEADDSAEHLYHYVREHRPDINAFFVLNRTSRDWDRLAGEGHRRLAFSEADHIVALLNASHLLSSHLDQYVWGFLDAAAFGDMLRYKFVWLQHGITQGDYSRLINFPPIDCLITSTVAEFESIVGDSSPYRYTRKETVLTGLPRHDILLSGPTGDSRTIVIMPTWRLSLAGPALAPGNKRAVNPGFYSSEFARRWKSVLHSPRLAAALQRGGYRAVFVPHPNLEPYIDFFEVPAEIKVRTFSDGQSVQSVFRQLSLFVTDYSSKAFDAAYLGKPVIYYQFDRDLVQGGAHLSVPGYFDYERDGFGPVHSEEADLIDAIEGFVGGAGADPIYGQRAAGTFVFRDGKCRERVLQAVLALSSPLVEPVAE